MATPGSCRAPKLAARARKRKSRAKPKAVIKQLLAHNPPNFKDLVQEYTGGSSSSLSSAATAQPYSASSANTSDADKTPANSCLVGHGAAALQMSHEDLMMQGSEACSHVHEWSCGGYGSPAAYSVDEKGKYGLSNNPAMFVIEYIAQSLKALEAISSSCGSPSPPFEEPACMPMMGGDFVSTGAMINAHLAKLLEHNIIRGNCMTSCRDQLHTLSLSCLLLMLDQMAPKAVGEGLR